MATHMLLLLYCASLHTIVGRELFKRVLVEIVASDSNVDGLTDAKAGCLALMFQLVLLDQLVKDLHTHAHFQL